MCPSPKIAEAILKVEAQILLKQNRIGARKLATRLCRELEIAENPILIPHFTRDPEIRTTVEAIAAWIISLMPDAEIEHSDVFDPIFSQLLRRKLQSIPGATPWN